MSDKSSSEKSDRDDRSGKGSRTSRSVNVMDTKDKEKDNKKEKKTGSTGRVSGKDLAQTIKKSDSREEPGAVSVQSTAAGGQSLDEELHRLWNRPFLTTSTVKDIGRLAKGLEIIDERGAPILPVLFKGEEGQVLPRVVYNIVLTLARALDPPEVVKTIEEHYWKWVQEKNAGDLTGQLIAFFGPTAGLKWSEDVKLLKVLKAVNQEVLAPPVLKMKMDVHKHLAYKDIRGGWTVRIQLKPDGEVVVSHVKQEQSHDSSPENHFEFTWSLVLSFNKDLSDFTSSLQILNYVFDEKTSRARQNEVKKILEPFVVPELPYRHIISRPQTNLGTELLRFCKTIEIYDEEQRAKLYAYRPALGQVQSVFEVIDVLAQRLEPGLREAIATNFRRYVKEAEPMTLQDFLASGTIPEDSRLMRVLKCVHQEIASPAVLKMRSELHESLPYKDVKGTWSVHISLLPAGVLVVHRKKEGSASAAPEDFFEFEWRLSLSYDPTITELKVAFNIVSYTFGDKTSPAMKKKWMDLAKNYFCADTTELTTISVSVSELLNSAITGLAAVKGDPPMATLPNVPSPVQIIEMLKRLDRTLTALPQTLPPISISVPKATPTPPTTAFATAIVTATTTATATATVTANTPST